MPPPRPKARACCWSTASWSKGCTSPRPNGWWRWRRASRPCTVLPAERPPPADLRVPRPVRLLGGGLQIGDHVGPLLGLLEPRAGHRVSLAEALRVGEVGSEVGGVPERVAGGGLLQGRRILKALLQGPPP